MIDAPDAMPAADFVEVGDELLGGDFHTVDGDGASLQKADLDKLSARERLALRAMAITD